MAKRKKVSKSLIDTEITYEVERVFTEFGLSDTQKRILSCQISAFPNQYQVGEVADILGMSRQAVSMNVNRENFKRAKDVLVMSPIKKINQIAGMLVSELISLVRSKNEMVKLRAIESLLDRAMPLKTANNHLHIHQAETAPIDPSEWKGRPKEEIQEQIFKLIKNVTPDKTSG